jgi:hypothetical protein
VFIGTYSHAKRPFSMRNVCLSLPRSARLAPACLSLSAARRLAGAAAVHSPVAAEGAAPSPGPALLSGRLPWLASAAAPLLKRWRGPEPEEAPAPEACSRQGHAPLSIPATMQSGGTGSGAAVWRQRMWQRDHTQRKPLCALGLRCAQCVQAP